MKTYILFGIPCKNNNCNKFFEILPRVYCVNCGRSKRDSSIVYYMFPDGRQELIKIDKERFYEILQEIRNGNENYGYLSDKQKFDILRINPTAHSKEYHENREKGVSFKDALYLVDKNSV